MNVDLLRYIGDSVRDRILAENAGDNMISRSTLEPIINFYIRVFEYNDSDNVGDFILRSRKENFIDNTIPLILQGRSVSRNIVGSVVNTVDISASESSKFTEELLEYMDTANSRVLDSVYDKALSEEKAVPLYDQLIELFDFPDYKSKISDQNIKQARKNAELRRKQKEEEREAIKKRAAEEEDLYDEVGELKTSKTSKKKEVVKPSTAVNVEEYEDIYGPLEAEEDEEAETEDEESSDVSTGKRGRKSGTTYKDSGRETGWDIYMDVPKSAKDRLIYDIRNAIVEIDKEDPLEYPSKSVGFFPRIDFEKSKDNFYRYIKTNQASREGNIRSHWPSTLEALYLLFNGKGDKVGLDLLNNDVYIHTTTAGQKKDKTSQVSLSSITRTKLDAVFEHFVNKSAFREIFHDSTKLKYYFGDKAIKLKWPNITNFTWMRGQRGKSNWNGCFYKDDISLCPEDIGHLEGGVLKKNLRAVEKQIAINPAPVDKIENRKTKVNMIGQALFSLTTSPPGQFVDPRFSFRILEFIKDETPFFKSITSDVKTEYISILDDIKKLIREVENNFESFQKIYSHEIVVRKSGGKSPTVNKNIDDDEDFSPVYVGGEEFVPTTSGRTSKPPVQDFDDDFASLPNK